MFEFVLKFLGVRDHILKLLRCLIIIFLNHFYKLAGLCYGVYRFLGRRVIRSRGKLSRVNFVLIRSFVSLNRPRIFQRRRRICNKLNLLCFFRCVILKNLSDALLRIRHISYLCCSSSANIGMILFSSTIFSSTY